MASQKKLYCHTVGCRMAYAVKGIMRMLNQRFAEQEINLTLEQYFILNILDNEEGLILQELAEIVDRDKSAVLRHINGLEENHYVARAKDPEDKRRKILLVTKHGVKVLKKAREIDDKVNEEVISHISSAELNTFKKHISNIFDKAMCFINS